MSAPWRFLAGLGTGCMLMMGLAAMAFSFNLGVPTKESARWTFDAMQKKRLRAEQTPSPRLLLVGGSATHFGVSARDLERVTGRHCINLATHAALGPEYLLHQVEAIAKPGDTILLVLEYELYTYGRLDQKWANKFLIDHIVSWDPAFFHSLPLIEQWNAFMLTSNQRLVQGLKARRRPVQLPSALGIYDPALIDDWGDQTRHTRDTQPKERKGILQAISNLGRGLPPNPDAFAVIRSFCQWAEAHHIRVLATFPNLADRPEYHEPVARRVAGTIRDFFTSLHVPVVGEYTDSLMPPDQFYDTHYHPVEEAAHERSDRLAHTLKPFLN